MNRDEVWYNPRLSMSLSMEIQYQTRHPLNTILKTRHADIEFGFRKMGYIDIPYMKLDSTPASLHVPWRS